MAKKYLFLLILLITAQSVFAYWEWTPKTRKWINPEYAAKETDKKQWEFAEQYRINNKLDKAVSEYKKLLKFYPDSPYAPKSLLAAGDIYYATGKLTEALDAYQTIISRYPKYPDISLVTDKERLVGEKLLKQKSSKFQFLLRDTKKTDDKVSDIIYSDPYSPGTPALSMKLAAKYMSDNEQEKAHEILNKTAEDFPNTVWEEKARYQLLQEKITALPKVTTDPDAFDRLIKAIDLFLFDFPSTSYKDSLERQKKELRNRAAGQIYQIGKYYERTGNKKSAEIYFRKVRKDYPDSDYAKLLPASSH